jgi:prephenate dehydrogenase
MTQGEGRGGRRRGVRLGAGPRGGARRARGAAVEPSPAARRRSKVSLVALAELAAADLVFFAVPSPVLPELAASWASTSTGRTSSCT